MIYIIFIKNVCSFTECTPFPRPSNGEMYGNMNKVGSRIMVSCKEGNNSDHSLPTTVECRANETHAYWTIEPFNCSRGESINSLFSTFLFSFLYFLVCSPTCLYIHNLCVARMCVRLVN